MTTAFESFAKHILNEAFSNLTLDIVGLKCLVIKRNVWFIGYTYECTEDFDTYKKGLHYDLNIAPEHLGWTFNNPIKFKLINSWVGLHGDQ